MMPNDPKGVLQIVVGPWQMGNIVAMEQSWRKAGGDLEKLVDGTGQGTHLRFALAHLSEQNLILCLHRTRWLMIAIIQDMDRLMHQANACCTGGQSTSVFWSPRLRTRWSSRNEGSKVPFFRRLVGWSRQSD